MSRRVEIESLVAQNELKNMSKKSINPVEEFPKRVLCNDDFFSFSFLTRNIRTLFYKQINHLKFWKTLFLILK
jgi:hypothetical protein